MKRLIAAIGITLGLFGCQAKPAPAADKPHPFLGCWVSEDGLEHEGWTLAPNGWLLGYAMSRDASNEVTFFEQMRIERGGDADVLVVSGGDDDKTVRFIQVETDKPDIYKFVNPEHDFPQAITYRPDGNRLDAEISALDGTKARAFPKQACSRE